MPDDPETPVSAGFVAGVLGITVRRVQQLAKEGLFEKVGRGRYPLGATVRAYQRVLEGKVERLGGLDLTAERARRERAQAEKTEFDLAVAKQRYVHVDVFETLLERFASIAASRFDAIRSRLKVKYPDLTTAYIDGIEKEISEARNAVAELRPPFDRPPA